MKDLLHNLYDIKTTEENNKAPCVNYQEYNRRLAVRLNEFRDNYHKLMKEETDEEIFKRWNNLGLLQGLDDTMAHKVAILYNKAAISILKHNLYEEFTSNREMLEWTTIVFPIIRRIATDSEENLKFLNKLTERNLLDMFIDFMVSDDNQVDWVKMIDETCPSIDVEAECLRLFCSHYFPEHAKRYLKGRGIR